MGRKKTASTSRRSKSYSWDLPTPLQRRHGVGCRRILQGIKNARMRCIGQTTPSHECMSQSTANIRIIFSKTIHFNKKNSDAPLPVALSHNYWTCLHHYSAGTGLAHRYTLNSSSWEAVSRGTFTLGRGLKSLSVPSRDLRRIMAMIRSSEIKNSRSDRMRSASSNRNRCTSVQ